MTCIHQRAGGPIPSRYDHIDLEATARMKVNAQRGLDLRRKHGRGGTRKGYNMARRIVDGARIHPDNVLDMYAFFERFAGQSQEQRGTDLWNPSSDDVSSLRIAWDLWGGDAGRPWARARRRQIQAADESEKRSIWSLPGMVTRSGRDEELYRYHVWRSWIDAVQGPTERQIRAQWKTGDSGLFPDQSQRIARRVASVIGRSVTRTVTQDDLDAIFGTDIENAILIGQFDDAVMDTALRRAFLATARQVGTQLAWRPMTDVRNLTIADMVQMVNQTTKDRISNIIVNGTEAGSSVNAIQEAIVRDASFSPMRALRVARTEAARVISEGSVESYNQSAEDVEFKVSWLSSRDGVVRPSHQSSGLDGQTIDPGGFFEYQGLKARGPGLFGRDSGATKATAALDINCRCTTLPEVA